MSINTYIKTYKVAVIYDAAKHLTVFADSAEEAVEIAENECGIQTVCWECSKTLDISDQLGCIVHHDGAEVLDTTCVGDLKREISDLKQQNGELQREIETLKLSCIIGCVI